MSGQTMQWGKACLCGGAILVLSAAASVSIVMVMDKNFSSDPGSKPQAPDFNCQSDFMIANVRAMAKKGVALDDQTYTCPDEIPVNWPHTNEPIRNLRLFKSVQPGWLPQQVDDFRERFVAHVKKNGQKVLIGTSISCSEDDDDSDWRKVRSLMEALGPDHVLGLAVGNEVDILHTMDGVPQDCVRKIWGGGYYLTKLKSRFTGLRSMKGFEKVPVTSVFTGGSIWVPGTPFVDNVNASVNTYLTNVLSFLPNPEQDWVFTLNFYPYFDPNLDLEQPGNKCTKAMAKCHCFDRINSPDCLNTLNMIRAREMMQSLTKRSNSRFWVGEVGWSAPMASTLSTGMRMHYCEEFSGYPMMYQYYKNFLDWDMDKTLDVATNFLAPEVSFYFTIRDSNNFGNAEYFGLIEQCGQKTCKLSKSRVGQLLANENVMSF